MTFIDLKKDLRLYASKEKAEFFPRFFKAGPGEYAQGDRFIGVTVPDCRSISKKYVFLKPDEIQKLIKSEIHEERLVALLILIEKIKKGKGNIKDEIFHFYLKNTNYINNWDLVDLSAHKIVGEYLYKNPNSIINFKGQTLKGNSLLVALAKSKSVWERRIAIISTLYFIKNNRFDETLKLSKILINDGHDLIHKAVGWMLREVGKKSLMEEEFLKKHYKIMPRTMLRYAIEKFPKRKRSLYLLGKI